MTLQISQGVRDGLAKTGALKTLLDGGKVRIYSGSPPASPNDAESGTLLVTVESTEVGNLMTFDTTLAGAGILQKTITETWTANAVATGTAGYWRYVADPADAGGASTTEERVQGTASTSGADMNMSSVAVVSGAPQTIDVFKLTIPE
jgi:hypothetical protein